MGGRFKNVDEEVMERARKRGRRVHIACQQFDEGDLDIEAWRQFDDELETNGEARILPYVESYGLMAATVLTCLPVFIVFLIGQKQFIKGVAMSGLKR